MGAGQDGCERRIKVFVKIQKKKNWGEGVEGGGGWVRGGGWSGWEGGGSGLGGGGRVEMDVNEEFKFLGKFTKKNGGGSGWLGGGVRVDVNAMLGVGGDVGYGGCEPRIEGIVQCTKRY